MEQKNKKSKQATTAKKREPEFLLAVFLLIFIAAAIALMAFLVVSYVANPPEGNGTSSGNTPGDDPSAPVFSSGVYPTVPTLSDSAPEVDGLSSEYAVLIDAESGAVLAHKNGTERFHPASMTKVMTLIVACERLSEEDLERDVILTEDLRDFVTSGVYAGASLTGFEVDDKAAIKDLLYGIGVSSAADCTLMVVQSIYPKLAPKRAEEKFVDLMNQKAEDMGLTNTHFENSVGVEGDEHYTTACEMAAIFAYALECPLIEDILSTDEAYAFYTRYKKDGEEKSYKMTHYSTLFNTNPERSSRFKAYRDKVGKVFELSEGTLLGGKTGTLTDPYRYSLASFAEKGGRRYILITGETRQSHGMLLDAKELYDTYAK